MVRAEVRKARKARREWVPLELLTHVFCPTGVGGGVDPTCSPGGTGTAGGGLLDPAPKEGPGKAPRGRAKQVAAEAARIPVTEERVVGDPVTRHDLDEIEYLMTQDERDDMQTALSDMREETIDSAADSYEPDGDGPEPSDVGWGRRDVVDRMDEELAGLSELDEEGRLRASEVVHEWYAERRAATGPDGVDEVAHRLEAAGLGPAAEAARRLRREAETALEEAEREWRDRGRDDYREALEDEYDDRHDRRQYLRDFYNDHSDEPRFSGTVGEGQRGKWGRDAEGNRAYTFTTSGGEEYQIWAAGRHYAGLPVTEVGFHDSSGKYTVTGAGGAHEVFREVSKAVTALMQKTAPPVVTFTAHEPSRHRLYDRLVKTISSAAPQYKAVAFTLPGGTRRYVIIVRDQYGRFKDMLPALGGVDAHEETLVNLRYPYGRPLRPEARPEWFTPAGWEEREWLPAELATHESYFATCPRDAKGHCLPSGAGELGELHGRIGKPDGGFTYSPVTGESPKTGYALSPYPERSFAVQASELKLEHLVDYAVRNADVLGKADHFMSGWHDPASGKVFLDVSIVARDPGTARRLCKKHDQIAYFDLSKGESVTVDPKATSGGVVNLHSDPYGKESIRGQEEATQGTPYPAPRPVRRPPLPRASPGAAHGRSGRDPLPKADRPRAHRQGTGGGPE